MYLKQITLTQYKNIRSKTFDFNPKINCFIGDNGKGKSNILDAIYHLAFGKSYFNPIATQNQKNTKLLQSGATFLYWRVLKKMNIWKLTMMVKIRYIL